MIKLYGAEWCGPCGHVKTVLNDNNIDYEYINVDDIDASDLGIRSIPVIIRDDGDRMVGFPGIAELMDFVDGGLK